MELGRVLSRRAAKAASMTLRMTLVPIEVRLPEDINDAFQTLAQERVVPKWP
jgi:hypothetical protein